MVKTHAGAGAKVVASWQVLKKCTVSASGSRYDCHSVTQGDSWSPPAEETGSEAAGTWDSVPGQMGAWNNKHQPSKASLFCEPHASTQHRTGRCRALAEGAAEPCQATACLQVCTCFAEDILALSMIRGIFIINNHGKARLMKCFDKLVRRSAGFRVVQCRSTFTIVPFTEGG